MNRQTLFNLLRFIHLVFDRSLTTVFGYRFRQSYIRMSYRIKTSLFPEYGTYIPAPSEIGSIPKSTVWIPTAIPGWVLEEMKDLAQHIDPVLYPSDQFLATCRYYAFPVMPRPGKIYRELMGSCSSDRYSHCFAIPWLKRGGADLVALKHIEVTAGTPGCKVLVILTEPGDSPWLSKIPVGVDVIDASRLQGEISHEEILLILVRILIQLRIDRLHIINSRKVWEVVCRYGLALSQQTRIFASIYCDDLDHYGQPVGFARQYLPNCYHFLTKVFSDNHAFPELLRKTYGYRSDLFEVLKIPAELPLSTIAVRKPEGRKVLWAGRLDRQKRPDLLLAIAKAMPDVEFHVYGDTTLDQKTHLHNRLNKLKNVRLLGSFDGAKNLPFARFPVFLYTSQWDGTPNIIISAALSSIPIVASCVGGVGDIVTEARGYPVTEIENVALYIERIREVLNNPFQAEKKAERASEYVRNAHTDATFYKTLSATKSYFYSNVTANAVSFEVAR